MFVLVNLKYDLCTNQYSRLTNIMSRLVPTGLISVTHKFDITHNPLLGYPCNATKGCHEYTNMLIYLTNYHI